MASDEQQFQRATRKWERLRDHHEYSHAPELGLTAIIYSQYETTPTDDESGELIIEHTEFAREANAIAESIQAQNGDAFIIAGISHESFEDGVMANRDVSNVVIISHGTFSSVFCDNGDSISWTDVSDMATHIKTGYVEQRFCGQYRFSLSVPFSLFAVESAKNIFAAKGTRFSPETNVAHEERIKPITMCDRLSYKQVRSMFPYQAPFKSS